MPKFPYKMRLKQPISKEKINDYNKSKRQKSRNIESNSPPSEEIQLLNNLQAGILKDVGRRHKVLLFIKFKKKKKQAIYDLLRTLDITSATKQQEQTKHKETRPNTTVVNFYLSHKGYKALSLSLYKKHPPFIAGMKKRTEKDEAGKKQHILGDTPKQWETPFKKKIHAILSLANKDLFTLEKQVLKYQQKFKGIIKIIKVQKGVTYTNENGAPIEHFGYVDGISQPLFVEEDIKAAGKMNTWKPVTTPDLVLTPDIGLDQFCESCKSKTKEEKKKKENCKDCEAKEKFFGSYMVFRKLEQNVKGFKHAEEALAQKLKFVGSAAEAAGAMIVGRFENGLPVIKWGSTVSPEENSIDNDFDYSLDPDGIRCPYHAHIRKVNPRGDNNRLFGISEKEEHSHRIARRGITYGERDLNEQGLFQETEKTFPTSGVGLLFICFQSDIANQFEFMQRNWANNNDFPVPFTGIDPIIGQGEGNRKYENDQPLEQQWRKSNGQKESCSFSSFVTMKGGEYFFAPSLAFFKTLPVLEEEEELIAEN